MKRAFTFFITAASVPALALAQPDPNNMPKGKDLPAQEPGRPLQMMVQMNPLEMQIRHLMDQAGYPRQVQTAVLEVVREQQKSRNALVEKSRVITEALRARALADNQMAALLAEFRADVDEAKVLREKQLQALDEKVNYSKKPHLEALLTVLGVIGDEAAFLKDMGGGQGMFMNRIGDWMGRNVIPPQARVPRVPGMQRFEERFPNFIFPPDERFRRLPDGVPFENRARPPVFVVPPGGEPIPHQVVPRDGFFIDPPLIPGVPFEAVPGQDFVVPIPAPVEPQPAPPARTKPEPQPDPAR